MCNDNQGVPVSGESVGRQMYSQYTKEDLKSLLADIEAKFGGSSAHATAFDCMMEDLATLREKLELAGDVIASAYQACGFLVMPEVDLEPSEKDQTDLLDLLSRWETYSPRQVEAFLPWPKVSVATGPKDGRKFRGVGHLEATGYIPKGSAAEREAISRQVEQIRSRHETISKLKTGDTVLGPMDSDAAHDDRGWLLTLVADRAQG